MSYSGTVTCSHCYQRGHNKRKCPSLTEEIKGMYVGNSRMAVKERAAGNENDAQWYDDRAEHQRKLYLKRTKIDLATGEKVSNKASKAARMKSVNCGYCSERGHTRRTCEAVKVDKIIFIEQTRRGRIAALQSARELGIGVGSIIPIRAYGYDSNNEWSMYTQLRYIRRIDWESSVARRTGLGVFHVEARHLGAANQAQYTCRDQLAGLHRAFTEARDHATSLVQDTPPASLVPTLEPPPGWLAPSEKTMQKEIKSEFPTTGTAYTKRRSFHYTCPDVEVEGVIKDLGLREQFPTLF